jgi:hypothetical protein
MKKISEMTDKELQDILTTLEKIESNEIGGLAVEIHTELDRRKKEQERKIQEKQRQDQERKAQLARKEEEERVNLLIKQRDILGKYFVKEEDDVFKYFQVKGVDCDYAIVTQLTLLKNCDAKFCKQELGKYVKIDALSKYKEVTRSEYDKVANSNDLKYNLDKKSHSNSRYFDDFFSKIFTPLWF